MATVYSQAEIAQRIVTDAAGWYRANRVPAGFRGLPPMMLAALVKASAGDWRRCVMDADGSVTVYNHPAWEPTE